MMVIGLVQPGTARYKRVVLHVGLNSGVADSNAAPGRKILLRIIYDTAVLCSKGVLEVGFSSQCG